MRRLNQKPQDKRTFLCPQCSKLRMTRLLDHVVSDAQQSYKTKDGDDVELFVDVCDHCKRRNFKKYFEPSRADVRRVLKTLSEDAKLGEDQSLEDLL